MALFDVYITAVHWHLTLFHGQSLLRRIEPILDSGRAFESDIPLLSLWLIILILGTCYVDEAELSPRFDGIDLGSLRSRLAMVAEQHYLRFTEDHTIESVAFSFLLSTYYLIARKTRRSIMIQSAALRAAHGMDLHEETRWGNVSVVERQVRRRVWWMLFLADAYVCHYLRRSCLNHAELALAIARIHTVSPVS